MGLSGIPVAAELIALHTIFELVRSTVSASTCAASAAPRALNWVRQAKAEGPARDLR